MSRKYICKISLSLSSFVSLSFSLSAMQVKKIVISPMIILDIVNRGNAFFNLSFWFHFRTGKFYYPDNIVRHVGKCPQQDFANSSPSPVRQFEIQKCKKHLSRASLKLRLHRNKFLSLQSRDICLKISGHFSFAPCSFICSFILFRANSRKINNQNTSWFLLVKY